MAEMNMMQQNPQQGTEVGMALLIM